MFEARAGGWGGREETEGLGIQCFPLILLETLEHLGKYFTLRNLKSKKDRLGGCRG